MKRSTLREAVLLVAFVAFVALMVIHSGAALPTPGFITVDGVSYESTQVSGPTTHYETPDTNPTIAFTDQHVWTGNGSENLPCEGGIHWIDNKNLLTVSHCLETPSTTTSSTTSTTTSVPQTTTTLVITTTTTSSPTTTRPPTTTTSTTEPPRSSTTTTSTITSTTSPTTTVPLSSTTTETPVGGVATGGGACAPADGILPMAWIVWGGILLLAAMAVLLALTATNVWRGLHE